MATKLVHGPWLHNDKDTQDPSWNSSKDHYVWCWIKPPSSVNGYFEIGKEVTEIRFCLSNEPDQESYECKTKEFSGLVLGRGSKTYRWKQVGDSLYQFVQDHPKLTHLSLEVR